MLDVDISKTDDTIQHHHLRVFLDRRVSRTALFAG